MMHVALTDITCHDRATRRSKNIDDMFSTVVLIG